MDFLDVLKTRRSVRRYTSDEVTDDMLEQLIGAAMTAPSAGNQQPWQFIIVRDREKLATIPEFHPYCKMVVTAPVAVIVCGDPEGKKWPDFWVQDCSAAIQNFLLAARDLGLGTVWTGVYPVETRVNGCRELFSIPENIIPLAIIPVCFPAEENDFKEIGRYNPALIHRESFQG